MSLRPFSTSRARERLRRLDQGERVQGLRYRKVLHSEEQRWYLVVALVATAPIALALIVMSFQHSLPMLPWP